MPPLTKQEILRCSLECSARSRMVLRKDWEPSIKSIVNQPQQPAVILYHRGRNSDEIKAIHNNAGNRNMFLLDLLRDVT
jgi:hypothetical protein